MRIQPIVEGHGEVAAVPVLLRRLRDEGGAYGFEIGKPIRQARSRLVKEDALRRAVQVARVQPDCSAVLIVFDGDDDCPRDLAPVIQQWAQDEAAPLPCAVVMSHREYEAWFLATVESLRGVRGIREDATSHPEPETPRDAKGRLEERMEPGHTYTETSDQPALTARLDLRAAHTACRSFRHTVSAVGSLATAMGAEVPEWPPAQWLEGEV